MMNKIPTQGILVAYDATKRIGGAYTRGGTIPGKLVLKAIEQVFKMHS
jgi:hypothetical protein